MGMSAYSRRRSREEYQKWLAWYKTLSPEEQQKEVQRIENQQLKGLLYILLGLVILMGMVWLDGYIGGR